MALVESGVSMEAVVVNAVVFLNLECLAVWV